MSAEETNMLYLAMDSTPVPREIKASQSHDVTVAELTVLPSYSPKQLAKV